MQSMCDSIKTIKNANNWIAITYLPIDFDLVLIVIKQSELISQSEKNSWSFCIDRQYWDTLLKNTNVFQLIRLWDFMVESKVQLITYDHNVPIDWNPLFILVKWVVDYRSVILVGQVWSKKKSISYRSMYGHHKYFISIR